LPCPPNMDGSVGKPPCLFSSSIIRNCELVQTSSKHQLLHLTLLPQLAF
jgi:hypothetical protein